MYETWWQKWKKDHQSEIDDQAKREELMPSTLLIGIIKETKKFEKRRALAEIKIRGIIGWLSPMTCSEQQIAYESATCFKRSIV